MKKKTLVLILSLVLIMGIIVGGTIAWLKDSTQDVVNTFTVGDIDIELKEHPLEDDPYDGKTIDTSANPVMKVDNYKMIPGRTLQKDPFVTVKANSEACWLFVKIVESSNFGTYMTYEIADGWTALGTDYPGVYYRTVAATTADSDPIYVLKNNQVVVKSDVTKAQLEAAAQTNPTLTFTAYAVQQEGVADATTAWGYATATN